MLTGFNVVKREGIEIAGSFAATVNADLTVGSLNETITVTGETPTVDIQSTRRSNVIPADVIDALPARSQYMLAVLLPGAIKTGGVQDVGGTRTMQITTFSIHGSRPFDQRLMINGITSRNLLSSAWASNFVPDMGTAAEVVVDYSSGTSESVGGGLGMNIIPKEGGNRFAGSFFVTGANGSMQSNNVTDELRAAGLSTPNKLKRVYDVNPSGGGPVFKDRLWFYGSLRFQESSVFQAGAFGNKNGGDLSKWTYEPDLSQPGEGRLTVIPSGSIRLTWQATPRNKISLFGRAAEPPLDQWAVGDVFARDLSGLAVQPRVADHGHVDGPCDQPPAPRGPVCQSRRGLRGQVSRAGRSVPASNTGARGDDRFPLSRQGLLLSPGLLRHPERAVHAAGVGVDVLHHRLACAQGGLSERLRHADAGTVRQRAGVVLHLQQRRADLDPAARAAFYPEDSPVAGHGHLRAGSVDVQSGDDQRRRAFGSVQEQVPGADARPGLVRAEPQYRDSGNALRQLEGHHAPHRRGLRSLRQRQDLAQEQLGQVHDRPQPPGR